MINNIRGLIFINQGEVQIMKPSQLSYNVSTVKKYTPKKVNI